MAKFGDTELQQRLILYQIFLRLYEHHSGFLEEILQLEHLNQSPSMGFKPRYIQGVVNGSVAYVITNLLEGRTLTLQQPQLIWTIGRDRTSGIHVSDRRVSRRHAAIRYKVDDQGFYLIDFSSTNGSYINGEPIYKPTKLKDGDQIRLGSTTFCFFINLTTQVLPTVALELLMQLAVLNDRQVEISSIFTQRASSSKELLNPLEESQTLLTERHITTQQKSEILDHFFRNRT